MLPHGVDELIGLALREDLSGGDWTSEATIPAELQAEGAVVARAPGVIAGLAVAAEVCRRVDPLLRFLPQVAEGARVAGGTTVATLSGPARSVLMAERTLLNFMQRLSGIATITARFMEALAGTSARLVDTRKTTPGWRVLEKAAVRAGGGHNHRFNLGDGVLIKDNHLAIAGGDIELVVRRARAVAPHTLKVEVEVESLEGVRRALAAGADIILLDNMALDEMRAAVELVAGRALLEASGGVTLERVRVIAETGVDLISCGALTHSATALDLALDVEIRSEE